MIQFMPTNHSITNVLSPNSQFKYYLSYWYFGDTFNCQGQILPKLQKDSILSSYSLISAHSRPILSRRKRSVKDVDPIRSNHVVTKMVLLHALGNAGMPRSREHILSYMQPNYGTLAWRRAAVHGLRHFTCNEVWRITFAFTNLCSPVGAAPTYFIGKIIK